MSLVGSLEDLGLTDILQIVSLSRKSGLLLLRSDEGDGRIFFRDGMVQAAYVKGEAEDLRALLVAGGFASEADLERALQGARGQGQRPEEAVLASAQLTPEQFDSLRREHVERAVLRMFRWRVGEFSFEIREAMEDGDLALALPSGINAQFLLMEATRLGDEQQAQGDAGGELVLSGEDAAPAPEQAEEPADDDDTVSDLPVAALEEGVPGEAEGPPDRDAAEALAVATAARVDDDGEEAAVAARPARPSAPLVVIDPELPALEWVKRALAGLFARIHIFQHSEGGIGRIRQYLSRAEVPVVLVSTRAPADTLTGASDVAELLGRLRAQAPRMPIVALHRRDQPPPSGVDAADGVVLRPSVADLSGAFDGLPREAEDLRQAMRTWAFPAERVVAPSTPAPARERSTDEHGSLASLKEMSGRLRDRATRGEVLNLVLDFAAQRFQRVAMFMVRDDEVVGIAQRGLPQAGGPGDDAIGAVAMPIAESSWLKSVTESGESLRAGPRDAGDRRLARALGERAALEAFLGPIESGGRVAVLIYGDNLPSSRALGDTTVLSIVLHEAGLALDRALLERTLADGRPRGD